GGESRAQTGYALARSAVAALAAMDRERGLTLFLQYWRETRSLDQAIRKAYGVTEAGFESEWKGRTRRRYGALALVADVSVTVLLFLAVLGPLWVIRRQRDRRRMAQMRVTDELQERREREDVLAAILSGRPEGSAEPPPEGG